MKVLITGANGLLGRAVVSAFLSRGHAVRAVVRPSATIGHLDWPDSVDVFRADLRSHPGLGASFEDVNVLVHLAAVVLGNDATHFASTVGGTERLLDAMSRSTTRRLVLASSFSVYGWIECSRTVDEGSPAPSDLYECGAYAIAKTWQERIARRMSAIHAWQLTVLRPGIIWGPGHELSGIVGPRFGATRLVVGAHRHLPLTYVTNCADCFVKAAEDPKAVGETFNVVDGHKVTAWRYAKEVLQRSGEGGRRIPVPYWLARANAFTADHCRRLLFGERGKLPALLTPRYIAYMRPLHFSNQKLQAALGWEAPLDFQEALEHCFQETAAPGPALRAAVSGNASCRQPE